MTATDPVGAARLLADFRDWSTRPAETFDDPTKRDFELRHVALDAAVLAHHIDTAFLEDLGKVFGDAVNVRLLDPAETVWDWSSGGAPPRKAAAEAARELQRHASLDAVLIFDRPMLAERLGEGKLDEETKLWPVLNAETVLRPLAAVSLNRDRQWTAFGLDYGAFTVFAALEPGPRLATELFEICAASELQTALSRAPTARKTLQTARRSRRERHRMSPLSSPSEPTPFHFQLLDECRAAVEPDTARAQNACDRAAVALALTYLSERTRLNGEIEAPTWSFVGHRRVEVTENPRTAVNGEAVVALCRMVDWTCDERIADKHGVVQNLVSLRLGGDAETNYSDFLEAAPRILASAESHWKIYLRRSTETYFDQQKELGELVVHKVRRYSEGLATLIKGIGTYGVTLLGFFFTEVFLKTRNVALETRQQVGTVFVVYSAAVLVLLFGYALYEELVLHRELQQERRRLGQFFGERELRDSVDAAVDRRRAQFYVFFAVLLLLSLLAVAWVLNYLDIGRW